MEQKDSKIIDGKEIAEEIQVHIKNEVMILKEKGIIPCLAVVLVGDRKDSQTYVRMKKLAAEKVGMKFILKEIPSTVTEDELIQVVKELNANKEIHGIIVQLPLPTGIQEEKVIESIDYTKDLDGLHPLNLGLLSQRKEPFFVPCTPKGCIELIERRTSLEGKNVVVLGRSNIVGIPVAMLCIKKNATVTICHSKTNDLPSIVKRADIVIAALGKAEFVKKEWIKEGAIVIDVGINAINDSSKKIGYRLVGDVDFQGVKQVASAITPVPGGVGPLTVAMILSNTLIGAKRNLGK